MNRTTHRNWLAIAAAALVAGCGLLPDRASSCDKPQPYQSAREAERLKVPAGLDAPDTRNALRVPAVPAPERPPEKGRCLDYPPAYGAGRPKEG